MANRKWVVALVIGGVLAFVAVAGAVVVMSWRVIQQAKPVQDQAPIAEGDKRLVVTAADLARIGGPAVDLKAETWTSLRQGNGNRFVLYVYEPASEPGLSLYSRLVILPDAASARRMYQMDKITAKLGADGASHVPAPGLLAGDDRSAWFIEKDGQRIGVFFLVREGRFLTSARLLGITLDTRDDVDKLLGPMLAESRRRASL